MGAMDLDQVLSASRRDQRALCCGWSMPRCRRGIEGQPHRDQGIVPPRSGGAMGRQMRPSASSAADILQRPRRPAGNGCRPNALPRRLQRRWSRTKDFRLRWPSACRMSRALDALALHLASHRLHQIGGRHDSLISMRLTFNPHGDTAASTTAASARDLVATATVLSSPSRPSPSGYWSSSAR